MRAPLFASVMLTLLSTLSQAAVFSVTTTSDAVDSTPGDGVCVAASLRACSLRAAIQEANALVGADSIYVPAGTYVLTITGASEDVAATGDLDIRSDITINGSGSPATIIDGAGADRVIDIIHVAGAPSIARISNLTIRNGVARGTGGGIRNAARLELSDAKVIANKASAGGGGIATRTNAGIRMTIDRTEIGGNDAGLQPCTQAARGGGILVENSDVPGSTIRRSSVLSNRSCGNGGGIALDVRVDVKETTIARNRALGTSVGGGLVANGVYISKSLLEGNQGFAGGGAAIFGYGIVINTTISGNKASQRGSGAALYGFSEFYFVTIANNVGGNTLTDGGLVVDASAPDVAFVIFQNSIVANNAPRNCYLETDLGMPAPLHPETGGNVDSDATCSFDVYGGYPSVIGTPAGLLPLAYNGGLTRNHALQAWSPAIDFGVIPSCQFVGYKDQRDFNRSQFTCDAGAHEFNASP